MRLARRPSSPNLECRGTTRGVTSAPHWSSQELLLAWPLRHADAGGRKAGEEGTARSSLLLQPTLHRTRPLP